MTRLFRLGYTVPEILRRAVRGRIDVDIVVFARYWMPGAVKTRLCPAIHLHCLDMLLERISRLTRCTIVIAYEPDCAYDAFAARYPSALLIAQDGPDLTARLHHILRVRDTRCLMTGSDCPNVPLPYYDEACDAFARGADVVLGPTRDGGSYILGLGPECADWFRDIPWSTDKVAETLRERSAEHGWRLHELPPWYDVDTFADLERLRRDLADEGISFTV